MGVDPILHVPRGEACQESPRPYLAPAAPVPSTHIQQQPNHFCLPTECGLVEGCAGLGLAVNVNASLEEESDGKAEGAGRAYSKSPLSQHPKAEPQFSRV